MKTYGPIVFSTAGAPHLFAGICQNYTYKPSNTQTDVPGEGEIAALIAHAAKGMITFSANPPATVTALGVRAGGALTLTGGDAPAAGLTIVTRSGAKWQKGQAMTMDVAATNYPDIAADAVASGTITVGTIALAYGDNVVLQLPTGKVWWGTTGLASFTESGIVQSCSIDESVQIHEEEGSGTDVGKIITIAVHTYKANASMEVLTTDSLPDLNTTLSAFGNFEIGDAEVKRTIGGARLISVSGVLIPGVTA